eukprot:scaffold6586_cov185-Alexandrium_tamarense.AAC.1
MNLAVIKRMYNKYSEALSKQDCNGYLPIHVAFANEPLEVLEYLTNRQPDTIDSHNNNGCTVFTQHVDMELPLHKACRWGHSEIIEYRLEMDLSSVSAKNVRNKLPIRLLCSSEGKGEGAMHKPEYVESIWKQLRAYPETVFVRNCTPAQQQPYDSMTH